MHRLLPHKLSIVRIHVPVPDAATLGYPLIQVIHLLHVALFKENALGGIGFKIVGIEDQ